MTPETRWWWVRHGPTHERAFVGWRNVPADLSDTAQIARLADYLPAEGALVSSDLIRASATAAAICGQQVVLPTQVELREMDFGEWDGRHFSDVAESHPELSRQFWEAPGDVRAPSGESWNDMSDRVTRKVDQLTQQLSGQNIIAVAHIGVILSQLRRATGQRPNEVIAQKIDNLSVTCLVFDGNWRAEVINHNP